MPTNDATTDDESTLEYWDAQLRAALERIDADFGVTKRNNAGDIVVTPTGGSTREERVAAIRCLERWGFTVTSSTTDEWIHVEGTAEPLDHPFDRSVDHPDEVEL